VGTTKDDEGEYIDAVGTAELMALFPPPPDDTPAPVAESADTPSGAANGADAGDDGDAGFGPPERVRFAPGGDRRTLRLFAADEALIAAAVEQADGPVVVAIMGGSAFVVPWLDDVGAAMQIWYPGMMGGTALGAIVTGAAEPGGRLPFAVPHDEGDLVDFDPDATAADYTLFHGHWHLERQGIEPHLPFGHGSGYTSFAVTSPEPAADGGELSVEVSNVGDRAGSTVVFVFGGLPGSANDRPARRLVGFRRIGLAAGARARVDVAIDWRQLDLRLDGSWHTEPGRYQLHVGQSSADIMATVEVDR
ncbi:MAG: glycoside hydrolase family 3 C-terminal domain-containing protein, partial [Actinomycetota bacterium]